MKRSLSIALAALVGFSAFGCATVTPPAAKNGASAMGNASCRKVATPDGTSHGALKEYCGSAAQWAQFDSHIVQVDMSCRNTVKSETVCLFNKQWEYRDKHVMVAKGGGSEFPAIEPGSFYPTYASQVTAQRASDVSLGYTVPVNGTP